MEMLIVFILSMIIGVLAAYRVEKMSKKSGRINNSGSTSSDLRMTIRQFEKKARQIHF
ncbi:hypothetical protein [Telluribacter sp.]|jgi:competence protein ComGC|uniref:hypothetical protein n=1 Tax=Telluribacter sp. TaxID=1978767 RepID=UPI002E130E6B|nr:hypothetical protein [Telluribacter sp.]